MATESDRRKFKVTMFLMKDDYDKIEDFIFVEDFKTVVVKADGKKVGTPIYKGGFRSKSSIYRPQWD